MILLKQLRTPQPAAHFLRVRNAEHDHLLLGAETHRPVLAAVAIKAAPLSFLVADGDVVFQGGQL